MLVLEPNRWVLSSALPVESMRPLWPRYGQIYADASCAPSRGGAYCIQAYNRAALERLLRYCAHLRVAAGCH